MKLGAIAFGLIFGLTLQAAEVPRPAPELTIREASGKTTRLSSLKGDVVVLQFLDTSCPHCQAMAGTLSKIQADWGSRGLQVFGIAFDPSVNTPDAAKNAQSLRNFATRYAKFPVGSLPRDEVLKYLQISVLQQFYVPQMMVIDRKGVIRAQDKPKPTGELNDETRLRALLNTLLKEPGAASGGGVKLESKNK